MKITFFRLLLVWFFVLIGLKDPAFPLDCRFNFRDTVGYCTDAANEKFVDGGADPYPQTDFDSPVDCDVSYGWQDAYSDMPRDRSATNCPRFAGMNAQPNDGDATPSIFRFNVTGAYCIELAFGDATNGSSRLGFEIRDGTGVLSTCDDANGAPADANVTLTDYTDASCVTRTSVADWNANQVPYCTTFSTYIAVRIGNNTTSQTPIAHMRIYTPVSNSQAVSVLNAMGEL